MTANGAPAATRITQYLCIGCPLGCRLEVEEDAQGDIVEVRGFSCKRGESFALQEHTDPRRMVSTTIRIDGGRWPRLPVRSRDAVPKDRVTALCRRLRSVTLTAPVRMGEVVLADALGTGIDMIASRDMPEV